jgi:uncharacterized protein (TIGR03382 family)
MDVQDAITIVAAFLAVVAVNWLLRRRSNR